MERDNLGRFIKGHIASEEIKAKMRGRRVGFTPWNKGKKIGKNPQHSKRMLGSVPWNKGIKWKEMEEEKNPRWKGNNVGYLALHKWVYKHLGSPNTCEHCGNKFIGRTIQWANKSGNYKRDVRDWIRLCIKCHREYDGNIFVPRVGVIKI